MSEKNVLPQGWKWSPVSDLGDVITGNTPPKKEPKYYGGFIPLVKHPELKHGILTKAKDNLSNPDVLAQDIVGNLEAALLQFESIAEELGEED
ncbi:MAG: hypothetical protein HN736_00240 [Anaerolineae bacterium]|jgi:restriction endonuclease S subunit|nr:hypothetical protein [Anaerolineae bacterium]MBT4309353.1 hypothetical protein [Anaerolineae bacterium]MBT4459324.1 hypothetical protein [Anaerolineae bacterium]MBT6061552.1 hypothetical protein [Anaerolineae bacterium]MBT7600114.1 hypothetical protein [Anaerolineae bacterium]